jgi:IS30 family transposase
MQKYRRVTYEDRCHISALLQAKYSVREITEVLGFHKSTIYRELKRNTVNKTYSPNRATELAARRFKFCRRKKLIDADLKDYLMGYLAFGWSPEQLSGRLRDEKKTSLSYQTIYRSFPKHKPGRSYMRRYRKRGAGRLRQLNTQSKKKVFIDQRPTIVEQRRRLGDWERDGMYGANRKQLLVFTDRKSRFTKIKYMGVGKSKEVKKITQDTLNGLGKRVFTVTNDNGTEFNDNASMPFKVFHCKPHKPHQRGTVENTIGLLRQYIKRNTDLERLTGKDLLNLENRINFRPRKCLGYKTPFEVFFNKKVALVV